MKHLLLVVAILFTIDSYSQCSITRTIAGNSTPCQSTTDSYVTESGMTNYVWTVTGGSISAGQGTNSVSIIWPTEGINSISVSYKDAENCTANSSPFLVSVKPAPMQPLITGTSQVCVADGFGQPENYQSNFVSNVTYQWNASSGGSIISPPGANQADIFWYASGSNWVSVAQVNEFGCKSTSIYPVEVKPRPTATISGSTAKCSGSTRSTLSVAFTGTPPWNLTYYDGTVKTTIQGITSNPYFFDVSPTTTKTYTITSLGDGNNCIASPGTLVSSATVTINTINPGYINGDDIICHGVGCSRDNPGSIRNTSSATGSGTISYQWQSSTDNINFTDIIGAISSSYDPPTGLEVTTYYRRIGTSTLNGVACSAITSSRRIRVDIFKGGAIGSSQIICNGGDPTTFTETDPSVGQNITYRWEQKLANTTGLFYTISGATGATYDVPPGLAQKTYYRRITESYLPAYYSCTSYSNIITVSFEPTSVLTGTATICNGNSTPLNIVLTGTPPWNLTYSDGTNTTSVTGILVSPYTVNVSPTSTKTYTVTALNNALCTAQPSDKSGSATITVKARPTATITSPNAAICIGSSTSISGTIMATGSWTITLSNGGGDVTGTGSTWTKSVSPSSNTTYTIASLVDGSGCSSTAADLIGSKTVTVNPLTILSVNPPAPAKCQGSSGISLTVSGGSNYIWTPTVGLTGTGATVYANPTSTTTYTVSGTGSNGCPGSTPVTVTVNPLPTVTTPNKVICSATAADLALTSDISGTTFSWTVLSKSSTISGVSVTSTPSTSPITHTLTNSSTTSSGTVVYRVTPTANSCAGNYKDVTVTVNSKLTGGAIAGNQTICENGDPIAFTQPTASLGYGTLSYQWQSTTDMPDVPFGDISGATSSLYNVPAGLMETRYYQRVTSSTQNGLTCKAVSSPPLTVTVNVIRAGSIATDQTICSGGNPVAFTETELPTWNGSLTHQWKSSINGSTYANITGATSKVYDAPALSQTTYYKRFATSVFNGTTCTAESNPVTVTVSSITAVITAASSTIFCDGQPISVVLSEDSNTGPNLSYQWTKDGINIDGAIQSSYQATEVGSYKVIVTNTVLQCSKTSAAVIVKIQTTGLILQKGDICYESVTLLALGSDFIWFNGSTSNEIDVSEPGTYWVNYTSVSGCAVYAETLVRPCISQDPCYLFPQHPCDEARVKAGEDEAIEVTKLLGVYPNPANDEVTVQIPEQAMYNLEVSLISQFGNHVGSSMIKKGETTTKLETSGLANGVYFVIVKSTHGFVMRQKVLVQHR